MSFYSGLVLLPSFTLLFSDKALAHETHE